MTIRLLLAPCCHDTIDLDPPDTEYLMIKVHMKVEYPEDHDGHGPKGGALEPPYTETREVEQPYHVACLKAGRGLKEGVSFEQVSIPGPLGTRRLAKRSEL